MNLKRFLPSLKTLTQQAGFTMIELLVVIAVIGVLAVAVLSSINPIEQINKGRDTRTRSDAAQLINAVDRYYAIHEVYPWNVTTTTTDFGGDGYTPDPNWDSTTVDGAAGIAFEFSALTGSAALETDWDWIDKLVETGEVKEGFINRLRNDNNIVVFKEGTDNATMYACFAPTSLAFKQEAMEHCQDGTTPVDGITANVDPCPLDTGTTSVDDENLICLP